MHIHVNKKANMGSLLFKGEKAFDKSEFPENFRFFIDSLSDNRILLYRQKYIFYYY